MPRPIIRSGFDAGPVEIKKLTKVGSFDRSVVLMNDNQKNKLIKRIETICRTSMEYKAWIEYLKDYMDMKECSFYKNVNNRYKKKISIEVHHEPFTLYDLVNIVIDKWLKEDWNLNPYLIAEEVMKLHYMNLVGLIPLSITVHQLVHDGELFVPLQNVKGDFTFFYKAYEQYISPELKSKMENKFKVSKEVALDLKVLEKKFIYLEVDGWELPQIVSKCTEEEN